MMGLTEFGDKLVRTYSGGMIRRLEIAQSTLHRPKVLFLDEPTVGLDPLARHAVWEMIARLRDEFGTTVFLTTHLMDEADALKATVAWIMHPQHNTLAEFDSCLYSAALVRLVAEGVPAVHRRMTELDAPQDFAELWFGRLFVGQVPFQTVLRIFDCYLLYGKLSR